MFGAMPDATATPPTEAAHAQSAGPSAGSPPQHPKETPKHPTIPDTEPYPLPTAGGKGRAHIVVLGAGFGGLTFCQSLDHAEAQITLIDRQNHHLFQPLLYQVATAALAAPDIAQPARSILHAKPNLTVLLDEAKEIDLVKRRVVCGSETLDYDFLVIGLGSVTSYFGHPEWEQFAPGLKSIDDALNIRRRLLVSFERAETTMDHAKQKDLMTMILIGGGATGVELAGAFSELAQHVLAKDFRRIDPKSARIIIIEGSPHVLGAYTEDLRENARKKLEGFGVEVRTSTMVKDVRDGEVELTTGEIIRAGTIVWSAGVAANPLTKHLGLPAEVLDKAGRIKVNADLTVPGHPEVFAIGDLALINDPDTDKPVPGVSPAAMQMGKYVAKVITDDLDARMVNQPGRAPFNYWDKGSMATIGRKAAVAMVGKVHLTGFIAWLAWLLIHVFFLIGFRSKVAVMAQWAYSYLTYRRSARVITGLHPSPVVEKMAG